MGGGQHLGRVGVQGAVVDVDAEGDGAAEADVLRRRRDRRVREEEGQGEERPHRHRVPPAQERRVAQPRRQHRPEDARYRRECVVSPCLELPHTCGGAPALEVDTVSPMLVVN